MGNLRKIQHKINRYAEKKGYLGGFWNGHQRRDKAGKWVIGVYFIRKGAGEIVHLTPKQLGTEKSDWVRLHIAANERTQIDLLEYVGGFPAGEQGPDGSFCFIFFRPDVAGVITP